VVTARQQAAAAGGIRSSDKVREKRQGKLTQEEGKVPGMASGGGLP
jgi:hypothetical protein